jgi:hypothetical protein
MRARLFCFVPMAVVALLVAGACGEQSVSDDVCGQAAQRVRSCGATFGFLQNGTCSGARKLVARCVVDHATDCDELATLSGRLDECVAGLADGGDDILPEITDLPVPLRSDAGARDTGSPTNDAALPPFDASTTDAAKEAGAL